LGVYREAGIIQPASILISDLLRWTVVGSITLIVVLTAGAISSERGTMADSVLSRGISRYQYFLGKWHARLVAVVGTFLALGLVTLAGSFVFLHEDLQWDGSLVALLTVTALLVPVVTCGVTFSAIFSSTVLGIAVSWVVLYGTGFALSYLLPAQQTPDRFLQSLPYVLRGNYDLVGLTRLMGWSLLASCGLALVGLGYFARRDV
jgi:ABC-type transport system involved in multi-copper enzyme maturation permease subunit